MPRVHHLSVDGRYAVVSSSAHVSGKARQYGRYRHVAVVRLAEPAVGVDPDQLHISHISPRSRQIAEVVHDTGALFEGRSGRCQFELALREAVAEANRLAG